MARIQMTYQNLLALKNDIQFQQKHSPAFYYFNKSRVEKLFSLNKMAFSVLQSRLDELVKKYVKFDKDMQPIAEEKDGQLVYCFYSDESRQQYMDKLNQFLSQSISIEL